MIIKKQPHHHLKGEEKEDDFVKILFLFYNYIFNVNFHLFILSYFLY